MKTLLAPSKSGALPRILRATGIAGFLPPLVLLLGIQFSASDALAQGGTWTSVASMPPVNTATAAGAAFGGKFYVIDSGAGYGVPLPLKVYDPVADNWSLKTADPVLRGETAVGVMNKKIYVAEGWGGEFGSDSNAATTALEIYDPASDSWTAGPSSLIARGLSATGVIGGKLYVAGGTASGYANFADLEIYDPIADSWSVGASLPNQLTSAGGAGFNGKLYLFGGYVGPSAYNNQITASVQIYDPVLDTWSLGTPMPTARASMAVGVIDGKLYIVGGVDSNGSTESSVVVYDPITDKWSTATDEPTPRAVSAAAVVDDQLFVAGGNTDSTSGTSTAEVLTPAPCGCVGQLLNISARLEVQSGDKELVGGFIVSGTSPKQIILRALGPSLSNAIPPVPGVLADPTLELHQHMGGTDTIIATNDNWIDSPDKQAIIDSAVAPTDDLESAIVATLQPYSSLNPVTYTVILRGNNNATGVALVEGYDLDQSTGSVLGNFSTRGLVETGDNVMIGGFILDGNSAQVIVRAIGPSLTNLGVAGALQDPRLELHDASGVLVASNDNWKDTQQTGIEATALAPTDDRESAILQTLAPGNYIAIVRGTNDTTGVALIEVYDLETN